MRVILLLHVTLTDKYSRDVERIEVGEKHEPPKKTLQRFKKIIKDDKEVT